jgi:glycosyltransferase involved in cell wall biosynthesis
MTASPAQAPAVESGQGANSRDAAHPIEFGPRKILHIGKYYPPHAGGMETVLRDLVAHQSSRFPVRVVVSNEQPITRTEFRDGARVTRVARFGVVASQPICPTLPFHVGADRDTLVHLHLPNPLAAQAYLLSQHQGKLIVTHHADTEGRKVLRKFADPVVRRVMSRAAAIIVTSRRYLETSEELKDFRHKCRVAPLGTDPSTFTEDSPEVLKIRARYGPKIVLAVGRLVPYKGFEYLLSSMVKIDATLLLIGTGPLLESLKEMIAALGLVGKAHLLEHVDDVSPYYKAACLLAVPSISRAEAFGMVQVEAMAAGIPVVNTDIQSGVPEVSLNRVTGITIPPGDSTALLKAIEELLANPAVRRRYGRAGEIRAHDHFSSARMAEEVFRVYASA